jgi:hypothetical protein
VSPARPGHPDRADAGPLEESRPTARPDESLLRGGLIGIASVTLATLGLAAVGALLALLVSLLY